MTLSESGGPGDVRRGSATDPEGKGDATMTTEEPRAGAGSDGDYEAPIGTLFLLTIYVIVLVGMWVTMYWLLVSR